MTYSWDREAEEQVDTKAESAVDETTAVVESEEDRTISAVPLAGDIFVKARAIRREIVPTSLRRVRSRGKHARRAAARANHPCQGPRMYIVDLDGESDLSRIALRRRFEETAAAKAVVEGEHTAAS